MKNCEFGLHSGSDRIQCKNCKAEIQLVLCRNCEKGGKCGNCGEDLK